MCPRVYILCVCVHVCAWECMCVQCVRVCVSGWVGVHLYVIGQLRRGTPVAHVVYGVPQTLNTANYVYFLALQDIHELNNATAVKVFLEEMLNLHRGQGMDIYWRDNSLCPSEEEYIHMVTQKTGGLFRLSVSLMQAFSQDQRDYIPLVNELGLMYQVLDDYLNLQSSDYHSNKSFCEDLTEGKYSFPVVHSIMASQGNAALQHILKQRPTGLALLPSPPLSSPLLPSKRTATCTHFVKRHLYRGLYLCTEVSSVLSHALCTWYKTRHKVHGTWYKVHGTQFGNSSYSYSVILILYPVLYSWR